jgi:hypothetical protein
MEKFKILGLGFLRLAGDVIKALLDGKISVEELKQIEADIIALLKSKENKEAKKEASRKK